LDKKTFSEVRLGCMTGLVLGGLVSNSSVNSSTCVSVNSEIGGKRVHMTITDIKVVVEWWKRERTEG
jgi:hypothetical protein